MPSTTQKQDDAAQRTAERIHKEFALARVTGRTPPTKEETEAIIREEHAELYAIRDAVIEVQKSRKEYGPDGQYDAWVVLQNVVNALGKNDEQDTEPQTRLLDVG